MNKEKDVEKLLIIDDSSLERDANFYFSKQENEEVNCCKTMKKDVGTKGTRNG
jgi:hypothetical protein